MSQAFKMNPQYEREGADDYIVIAVCSASLDTTSHNNFDHSDHHENGLDSLFNGCFWGSQYFNCCPQSISLIGI